MEHTSEKIAGNTLIFTGAMAIQKIIAFSYFWFLSALLTPEQLGTYIWALSITTLFSIGIDLGLSPLLIREAARERARAEQLLRGVIALKLLFALVTAAVVFAVIFLTRKDPVTLIVVSIAVLVMLFDSFALSFWSVLRAMQKIKYESFGLIIFHILVFALGAYLLGIARTPIFAVVALALGSASIMIFAWLIVRFRFGIHTAPLYDHSTLHSLILLMPAFAAAGIFMRLYNAADTVLLGYLLSNEAVGLYSVPAKAMSALQMLIPGAFMASIYPAMSYYFAESRERLEELFERSIGYLGVIVLPVAGGILVLIPKIMDVIWPQYAAVAAPFAVMTAALPFLFFSFPTGYLLNAANRQRNNTINRGVITGVNIALNLALIPVVGVMGAALAFLISNVLLFFLDFRNVKQVIPVVGFWIRRVLLKSAAATVIMIAAVWSIQDYMPLIFTILAGFIVYLAAAFVLRILSKQELVFVRELFKSDRVNRAIER